MKFQIYFTALLLIFVFNFSAEAQNPFDCIDAMAVCDNSNLSVDYIDAISSVAEEIDEFCTITSIDASLFDENTIWFKYQFKTSGDFYFTISPEIPETDIDFVLFDAPTKSCDSLASIRCMFSGQNFQAPFDSICSGPTGLSPNSIDTFEEPGCQIGNDNFLASVDVESGQILYLAVINFSNDASMYSIIHGGSAEISCLPLAAEEIRQDELNLFPNPTSDALQIEFVNNQTDSYKLELYNATGENVLEIDLENRKSIDISHLAAGIYYAKILTKANTAFHKKIIKI